MRLLSAALAILVVGALVTPRTAPAQSTASGAIAGVVRDTTGAVMPGVTVEASSPALIEKVRTAVTDSQGQYKILELRPGRYSVTFTLTGFTTIKREGVDLTAGFTAAVNSEMRVGDLEETLTVVAASPVVDVQNVRSQNVLSREVLDTLPTAKNIPALAALTVGITSVVGGGGSSQDVGGDKGEQYSSLAVHGGSMDDGRFTIEGMKYTNMMTAGGGGSKQYFINQSDVQEMVLETSGAGADTDTGGVQVNVVPKQGGNVFSGNFALTGNHGKLQGSNLSESLRARGLTSVAKIKKLWDVGGGIGGPIKKDSVWFYTAHRWWGAQVYAPGNYYNATHGTPFYTPDLARQGYTNYYTQDHTGRITWQMTQKQKLTVSDSHQNDCNCHLFVDAGTVSPEASTDFNYRNMNLMQAIWTYPASNRLLFQAGATFLRNKVNYSYAPEVKPTDVPITDSSRGYTYNAAAFGIGGSGVGDRDYSQRNQRFAVSYITGSHALKAGLQMLQGKADDLFVDANQELAYTFLGQRPVSLTQYAGPTHAENRIKMDLGLYVQDQWTLKRLTLNVGLRFDSFNGYVPEQTRPAGKYVPEFQFARIDDVVNMKDLGPRVGAAYDLFGNGKTAVKVMVGRYISSLGGGIIIAANPANAIVTSTTRTWTDTNGNYVPDCNLSNFNLNGECGLIANRAFGTVVVNTRYADDIMKGFGKRGYNWQTSAQVTQELRPGMSATVGFFRNTWGNITVTENTLVTPADYDEYCITAPTDTRLPDGGSSRLCGLYDIKPAKFGQVSSFADQASKYGDPRRVYTGLDATVGARFGGGATIAGGASAGRSETRCVSPDLPSIQFCDQKPPFSQTLQVKLSGQVPLPWWGINLSANLQNLKGQPLIASYVATSAQALPSLGRNFSSGANGTATIQLLEPGQYYEERLTQVDVRFAKNARIGAARIKGTFDIYNMFNEDSPTNVVTRFGPTYRRPASVLGARTFKFGGQVDF